MSYEVFLIGCGVEKDEIPSLARIFSQIHSECFLNSWTSSEFQDLLILNTTLAWSVKQKGTLIGFILVQTVDAEAEILTIAVLPKWQGRGIGTELLNVLHTFCQENHIKKIYLEVKENNDHTIYLYEKQGFKKIGQRRAYYTCAKTQNTYDALVLEKTIE